MWFGKDFSVSPPKDNIIAILSEPFSAAAAALHALLLSSLLLLKNKKKSTKNATKNWHN